MDWMTPAERKWEEGYSHAEEYFFLEGTLPTDIHYKTESGFPLGKWVYEQKKALEETGKIPEFCRERLQIIGIE